jgi:hypothetical protein
MECSLVASTMRLFLSELPDPLFTFKAYPKFLELNRMSISNISFEIFWWLTVIFLFLLEITSFDEKVKKTREVIDTLPRVNKLTIRRLLLLLHKWVFNPFVISRNFNEMSSSLIFDFWFVLPQNCTKFFSQQNESGQFGYGIFWHNPQ